MSWRIDVPMPIGRPGRPLSMNDRLHWAAKAAAVQKIRDTVTWTARSLKIPHCERVTVQLHYAPGRGGRFDADNLVATSKPALDGIVRAGVIKDDSPEYVNHLMPVIHPGKGHRALWLEIEVTQ